MKISHGNNFNYDPILLKNEMSVLIEKNKVDKKKLKRNKKVYMTLINSDWVAHNIGWHKPR